MTDVVSPADHAAKAADGAAFKVAGPKGPAPSRLSADLMGCRRLPPPRHGALMIVGGLSGEAEPLMRCGVQLANHLGAHLLSLSYSPYRTDGVAGSVEERAARRLLDIEGERFEALSSSVRGGRTWLPSTRAMLPSVSALAWWADLVMLNAEELGEGAGAWRRLNVLAETLDMPILVRPTGAKAVSFNSVVLVNEASGASRDCIRRALPLILKAQHVKILAGDGSADILKSGLVARGLKASSIEIERKGPTRQAEEMLRKEEGHVVVHGGAFTRHLGRPFRRLGQASMTEYQSLLLV